MRILSVNNYQTQNQKQQNMNFGASKFDTEETLNLAKSFVKLTRLDLFLKENKWRGRIPRGADECYIVDAEGKGIISRILKPRNLVKSACKNIITKGTTDRILEPSKQATLDVIQTNTAVIEAQRAHEAAKLRLKEADEQAKTKLQLLLS